ncbi:putative nucleotide-sugar transporter [Helianthus annuus]|nr:putative nucleotide-sugar transporter [Helianthus annuus]
MKSVVTLALTFLTSSQAILIVWSKRAGRYEYSVTTANFLVEALKCALSLVALGRIWRTEGVTDDNRYSVLYCLSALSRSFIAPSNSHSFQLQYSLILYSVSFYM